MEEDWSGEVTSVDDPLFCEPYNFAVCAVVIGIICVLGLVGNCTSLYVLIKQKTETATIFLLQAMCVSDSCLLLSSVVVYCYPAFYTFIHGPGSSEDTLDHVVPVWPLATIAHTCTVWITVLVTFTRYRAVCKPQQTYRSRSRQEAYIQVSIVLILCVVYNIPRFFEHYPMQTVVFSSFNVSVANESAASREDITNMTIYLGDSQTYQIVYSNLIYCLVMYVVPFTSLSFMNVRLIRSLNALDNKKTRLTGRRLCDVNITRCVVIIVCVFFVCQTPALINQIFWAVLPPSRRGCGHFHYYYTKISDVFVVLNSACDIVIYCMCGRQFRAMFMSVLCPQCVDLVRERPEAAEVEMAIDPTSPPLEEPE